jgi:hypothetical protein
MRKLQVLSALTFALACILPAAAQSGSVAFQSGEWQVSSVVTTSTGQKVGSEQRVCANKSSDFWTQSRPNLQCDAPTVTPVASGYRIQLACHGSSGPVEWKMQSDITETFSNAGHAFTATGNTTTTTTIPGRGPITASASIQSKGTYQGACGPAK